MYRFVKKNNYYECYFIKDDDLVCECTIAIYADTWQITRWFTKKSLRHTGYGKKTMQKLLSVLMEKFPVPLHISYVWNGENEYVYKWIRKNFDAYCKSPLAVQKYQPSDDWDSHIYILDRDKFFTYFWPGFDI